MDPIPTTSIAQPKACASGEAPPLVTVSPSGVPLTTSLVIAEGTDNQHKNVLDLVRTYQSDLEELGGVAFETHVVEREQLGGRPSRVALLNQEQATFLLTLMRNSDVVVRFKLALVKAFFEMAKRLSDPLLPFRTMPRHEMLRVLADEMEQKEQARALVSTQQQTIATLTPKAEFADRVSQAPDCLSIREFAKVLGDTGQNRLYTWLRARGFLIPGGTEPYQRWVDLGLFRVVEHAFEDAHGVDRVSRKTLITGKGQLRLQSEWDQDRRWGGIAS